MYADANPKRIKLSKFDADYAKANIDKHGKDYKAMQMDIKTNDRQYSAKKMETLCKKYYQYHES